MEKIQRVSRAFRKFFIFAMFVPPVASCLAWLFLGNAPDGTLTHAFLPIPPEWVNMPVLGPISWCGRLIGLTGALVSSAFSVMAFYFLVRLFELYGRGEIFTAANVRYIRLSGWMLLVGALFHPFNQAATSIGLTLNNPPGQRMLQIGFSSVEVSAVITALLIILVSWIMDEGRKLKEEDALFI